MLLNEAQRVNVPGFRKGSKVVPPVFRRANTQRFLDILLYRWIKPSLEARLAKEKLSVLPNLEIREHSRVGDEIKVACEFEVRPTIPPPLLEGKVLLKPNPAYPDGYLDVIIERIRRQHARWINVNRAAAEGDRVSFKSTEMDKPQTIELLPNFPEDIKNSLVGAKAGDEIKLDLSSLGQNKPSIIAHIEAVKEAKLPELDLAFARRFMPNADTVEAFRDSLAQQVKKHTNDMVEQVLRARVLRLLDDTTDLFELPEKTVAIEVQQQREKIVERMRSGGREVSIDAVPVDKVQAIVEQKVRNGLIFEECVLRENIKITPEQVEAEIDAQAADHQDPKNFRKQLADSQENISAFYELLLSKRIVELVCAKVTVKADDMSLEQLDKIYRGVDSQLSVPVDEKKSAAESSEGAAS